MTRRANNDEVQEELEELRKEVRSLRASQTKLSLSKKAIIKEMRLSVEDVLFWETVTEFNMQYLFPRFKFLYDGWMDIDPTDSHCFSSVVKRHFPMPDGRVFEDEWTRIMVRSIAVKYTQLRCNVNNMIRDAFIGKYTGHTVAIVILRY